MLGLFTAQVSDPYTLLLICTPSDHLSKMEDCRQADGWVGGQADKILVVYKIRQLQF